MTRIIIEESDYLNIQHHIDLAVKRIQAVITATDTLKPQNMQPLIEKLEIARAGLDDTSTAMYSIGFEETEGNIVDMDDLVNWPPYGMSLAREQEVRSIIGNTALPYTGNHRP